MRFIKPKLIKPYLIFIELIKPICLLTKNVRTTLKSLGARLKKCKNAKKVKGWVSKR